MRKLFYVAAAFALTGVLTLTAATRSHDYIFSGKPGSTTHEGMLGSRYGVVYIGCTPNYCELLCNSPGNQECSWSVGLENCIGCFDYISSPGSLFELGEVQDLFDYAEDQIATSNYSGTHYANFVKNSMTYYRTVTWSYNSTNGQRDYTATVTEVTP